MEILATLERLGASTPTSLDLPADLSYERYEALLVVLGRAHRTVAWSIGDAINFGERAYGEKYAHAVEALNMTPETLMNYASIARKVPRERRREELPFSTHALVAPLEPEQQERWLDDAVENDWTRGQLRDRLRGTPPEPRVPVVVPDLQEAARHLVASAQVMGDGFLVRRQAFEQLCAILGEPL
jgi:hypothetical protein